MSARTIPPEARLGDMAALWLQHLRQERRLPGEDRLLRIDNRAEAETAPFLFDTVAGVLHRRGCRAIPPGSRSALYRLWRIGGAEQRLGCRKCRPMADDAPGPREEDNTDLLFGLLSVVGQFAGVLKERGRDYQKTREGRKLSAQLGGLYGTLGEREREMVSTVLTSLDQLVRRIRDIEAGLQEAPGPGDD